MWIRLMPGVVVAALLLVFFGNADAPPERRKADLSERVLFSAANARQGTAAFPSPRPSGFEENGDAEAPQFFASFPAVESGKRNAPAADAASAVVPLAIVPEMLATTPAPHAEEYAPDRASLAIAPKLPKARTRRRSAQSGPLTNADGFTLIKNTRLASRSGKSSENAYASMALPAESYNEMESVPSGDLPPLLVQTGSLRPPARGVRTWASGEMARAQQDLSVDTTAAYRLTGQKYSLGLDYDWSVDTVLGASVDMLDYRVKSGHQYDSRKTDIDGYAANVSLDTVMFDSYLLGLKGFYGKLDNEGDGYIGAWDDNGKSTSPWREFKHRSHIYGLSGNVRVPMLFWGYRAVIDAGVDYKHIKTDPYSYWVEMAGDAPSRGKKFSSSSLAIPVAFSLEKDFFNSCGLITSRLGVGYTYETSDTAAGVRAMNALSAVPVYYESTRFHGEPYPFYSVQKGFYHVNLGFDVKTTGGWNVSVDYRRDFGSEYYKDNLKLELGRSF